MMQQATKPTASRAAYFRAWRSKRKVAKQTARAKVLPSACKWPENPGLAIAQWSREKLIVPDGHPRSGEPLILPDFLVAFLVDVYRNSETALLVARKNSKSTAVSVALLAHISGPLRRKGFRAGVISLTALKASELKDLMHAISVSSGLEGIRFLRSPAPGRVESEWGRVEIFATEKASGHSSSFDISIAEELGLYKPRDRDAVSGMRSAVSAKAGRFVSLSVVGNSEYVQEILERHRRGEPGLSVHLHAAPPDCALDDRAAWKMANPALGISKQWKYMEQEARRVSVTVSDQGSFRALELNQQQDPGAGSSRDCDRLACVSLRTGRFARAGGGLFCRRGYWFRHVNVCRGRVLAEDLSHGIIRGASGPAVFGRARRGGRGGQLLRGGTSAFRDRADRAKGRGAGHVFPEYRVTPGRQRRASRWQ